MRETAEELKGQARSEVWGFLRADAPVGETATGKAVVRCSGAWLDLAGFSLQPSKE